MRIGWREREVLVLLGRRGRMRVVDVYSELCGGDDACVNSLRGAVRRLIAKGLVRRSRGEDLRFTIELTEAGRELAASILGGE